MKKTVVYSIITATLALAPLAFTTGCAVTSHKETARAYYDDKKIAAEIKTKMYRDPMVKGTEVKVQCLNGVVELSGFVDSQMAKDRAEQIASSTAGVVRVYNSLILPTGR